MEYDDDFLTPYPYSMQAVNSRLASECDDGVARLLGMDLVSCV